ETGEDRCYRSPCGFFRCNSVKRKMRVEGCQANELRSGISTGPCNCDAYFFHLHHLQCTHRHKKREGLEPSLFLAVAPMFIALSTGTASSHPSVRTFSVL